MNKNKAFGLLGLLIVLAIIAGGYLVVKNMNKNVAVDETANWKTYRNEKYGFEFKYPPERVPFSGIKGGALVRADEQSDTVFVAESEAAAELKLETPTLMIYFQDKPVNVTEALALGGREIQISEHKATEVLGRPIYKVIIIEDGNDSIVIKYSSPTDLLEQILSTFKFTK